MAGNTSLFDNFMPHGMCYLWRPDILWLNVGSDAAIAIAYFSIPFVLFYFLRRKSDVPFPGVIYMFCVFIFACGLTHVVSIWSVWHGQYGLQGLVKAFTALASVATAIMLFPVTPKLLALRSPRELEQSNLVLQDQIEKRKMIELQSLKLQGDLARLGRIATVGQMATGLAHELNQPLLVVAASADTAMQLAKKVERNDPELFECLDDIQNETQRAGDIIRALRQFVSNKSTSRIPSDLNSLVAQAVRLMAGDARSADTELIVKSADIPEVNTDTVQIAQVLVNLIRNAVEAISEERHQRAEDKKACVTIETKFDGTNVSVTVSDTGPGLSSNIEPFQAFDTNKSDGMGVGLSISRDIIASHGGRLVHDTDYVNGASFTFELPAVS